ncbi:2-oxoglutarate dehydrogenase N-terminus [Aquiflexum balticum DSM 16537]|uniref:2-oxoglutarate dehydrogenase N-terminus n=1 Tax=Aquiflexum balticum DSM 16537 TaxID=758820 RepID=A0A1W2H064_9BACT|nr:2-oxoglutarate dehydrogenase N-terminus [Aquiflexum balticum DSM 16537]
MDKFSFISNAHVAYIDELYAYYKSNPENIDPSWKTFFDGFDFAITKFGDMEETAPPKPANGNTTAQAEPANGSLATRGTIMDMEQLPKEIKV